MCATHTVQSRISLATRDLGEAIRLIRKRRLSLSQQEFADKLGVSRHSTVSDWERGKAIPPPERLEQIAELVGLAADELFGDVRPSDIVEAEEWLGRIVAPDLLRRLAGTPTYLDVLYSALDTVGRRQWPAERKTAVQALLNQMIEDAQADRP